MNLGVAKHNITKSLSEAHIAGSSNLSENEKQFTDFIDIINSSPILTLEFIVYKNLENKTIKDENSAIRYIDENIKIFKTYNKKDIIKEHKKIEIFFKTDNISENKLSLYNSINDLIIENSINSGIPNIDKIHESFEFLLTYIKSDKQTNIIKEDKFKELKKYFSLDFIQETIVKKFNEKYDHLNENEKNIIKILTQDNESEKEKLFNNLKEENRALLKSKLGESIEVDEKINQSFEMIDSMIFETTTILENVIKLNKLKESLL